MLDDEKVEKDKEVIALSLFQLGSLNSITTLKEASKILMMMNTNILQQNLLKKLMNMIN